MTLKLNIKIQSDANNLNFGVYDIQKVLRKIEFLYIENKGIKLNHLKTLVISRYKNSDDLFSDSFPNNDKTLLLY